MSISVLAAMAARATLLIAAGFLASMLLRHRSAATRHLVWTLTFGAVLALPFVQAVVPEWGVLPRATATTASEAGTTLPPAEITPAELDRGGSVAGNPEFASSATGEPSSRPAANTIAGGADAAAAGAEPSPATGQRAGQPAADAASGTWAVGLGLVFLIWLTGAAARIGVLALGATRVSRLRRGARPVEDPSVIRMIEEIASNLGLARVPVLRIGDVVPVPLTAGVRSPEILLPSQARSWSTGRLRRVLLHESAHIARRDLLAQWVAEAACALHWFNPLVWTAVARMRMECEHATDDVVLALGVRPSAYAEDLLEIVRGFNVPRVLAGTAPMARPAQLGDRLRAVLDPARRRGVEGSWVRGATLVTAGVLLMGTAAMAPADGAEARPGLTEEVDSPASTALPASTPGSDPASASAVRPPSAVQEWEVCSYPQDEETVDDEYGTWVNGDGGRVRGTMINSDEDRTTLVWTGQACTVRVEVPSETRFNTDETDVASVPSGTTFTVLHRTRAWTRELTIRPNGDRTYQVDGEDAAWDATARTWTAGIVLTLFRRTGFRHEERSARIYREAGWPGLQREIGQLPSSWVAARYLDEAFGLVSDARSRQEVLDLAATQLEEDYSYAGFLERAATEQSLSEPLRRSVIASIARLDDDYHARRVFSAVLQNQDLDADELMAVIASADETLEGDYSMAQIYGALLEDPELDREGARRLVQSAAARLEGDHALQELLVAVGARQDLGPWVVDEVLAAIPLLDGDYARRQVLSSFISRARSAADLRALMAEIERLEGDYDRARMLDEITSAPVWSEDLRGDWIRSVGLLDGYRIRELFTDWFGTDTPSASEVESILRIGVEQNGHDGSRILVALAETGAVDEGAARAAYIEAAGRFEEHEERRILAALGRD